MRVPGVLSCEPVLARRVSCAYQCAWVHPQCGACCLGRVHSAAIPAQQGQELSFDLWLQGRACLRR